MSSTRSRGQLNRPESHMARRLTPEQRANVLEAYRAMVKDRNEAEKERIGRAAERKQNEKQKQKIDPLWDIV